MRLFPNTIINFHAIYDRAWMENVLQLLNNTYKMVHIGDLKEYYYSEKDLDKTCHITFDDGDVSFYRIVFPLLKKYNIPASIFVSPMATVERKNFWFQEISDYDANIMQKIISERGYFNKTVSTMYNLTALLKSLKIEEIWDTIYEYQRITNTPAKPCVNMDKTQLLDLSRSNLVEIGAHTLNHPILKNETDRVSEYEIRESIEYLSHIIDRRIEYFAYPNGISELDFGEREMITLKKCGIKLAFSAVNSPFSKSDMILSIPRSHFFKGCSAYLKTKLILGNKWDLVKRIIKGKNDEESLRRMILDSHIS
ncbi:Polysaccharide deacetylase [Chitinispirillum alkaliphilum]|nr:Polysaccharide deacetylase [Chitinispirillum alkaliphilum]